MVVCNAHCTCTPSTEKGTMGAHPPTWISKIFDFQGVFRPAATGADLRAPWKEKKISPPRQFPEYAPASPVRAFQKYIYIKAKPGVPLS